MNISISRLKKIIKEEIESEISLDMEGPGQDSYTHIDEIEIENNESSSNLNNAITSIKLTGEKLVEDFMKLVGTPESSTLREFILEFIEAGEAVASLYGTDINGQIASATDATRFFQDNLDRFSENSVQHAIDAISFVRDISHDASSDSLSLV